jgi:hypothetical protein
MVNKDHNPGPQDDGFLALAYPAASGLLAHGG